MGMLMDFHDLEDIVTGITSEFDHSLINEHPSFTEKGLNPTAENLSFYIYTELEQSVGKLKEDIEVHEVILWESVDASATYRR